jgi:hypothetical protein
MPPDDTSYSDAYVDLEPWARAKLARTNEWAALKVGDHIELLSQEDPDDDKPRYLFVRKLYVDLFTVLTTGRGDGLDRICGMVLLGQPGAGKHSNPQQLSLWRGADTPSIGKSTAIEYLVPRLLAENVPVLYALDTGAWVWFACGQFEITLPHSSPTFYRSSFTPESVAFFDETPPQTSDWRRFPGLVLQVTSPRRSRWESWTKQAGAAFYIPPTWSLDEVAQHAGFLKEKKLL